MDDAWMLVAERHKVSRQRKIYDYVVFCLHRCTTVHQAKLPSYQMHSAARHCEITLFSPLSRLRRSQVYVFFFLRQNISTAGTNKDRAFPLLRLETFCCAHIGRVFLQKWPHIDFPFLVKATPNETKDSIFIFRRYYDDCCWWCTMLRMNGQHAMLISH